MEPVPRKMLITRRIEGQMITDIFWQELGWKGTSGPSTVADRHNKTDKSKQFLKLAKFCPGTLKQLQFPIALFFQVTVNVLEVNDEEPVCSPNFFSLQIPVDLAAGTNINGFRIECQDRDSDPRSFRYFINEGTVPQWASWEQWEKYQIPIVHLYL